MKNVLVVNFGKTSVREAARLIREWQDAPQPFHGESIEVKISNGWACAVVQSDGLSAVIDERHPRLAGARVSLTTHKWRAR